MQWNIRRRKTRSERLRETSCCDEWRYGDVVIADLAIVFSKTSGILISHFYEGEPPFHGHLCTLCTP